MSRPLLRHTLPFVAALLFNACATAPLVGVRAGFDETTVGSIAVAPLWASSSFGLDETAFEEVRATYHKALYDSLRELGFEIVSDDELRTRFEAGGALDELDDIATFSNGLAGYFEPELYARETREVTVVRALHARGAIPADTLLVTEIVYHSTGVCIDDPREHNKLATVIVGTKVSRGELAPSPCVVSHFQAKLVDPGTGRTMWHNRFLRELRVDPVSAEARRANIEAAVRATIHGEFGLGPFAPRARGFSRVPPR